MAEVKKLATRDGYGKGLVALGAEYDNVVALDADLAGSTKTGMFKKAYPDRHFNCGIAEADMMCGCRHGLHRTGSLCQFLCHVRCRPRL